MVAGVDVRNVGLNRGRKGVGLEQCAAGVGVAVAGCHGAPGRLADGEVCKADVGLAIARYSGRGVVTGDASVVVLRSENVKSAGADVADMGRDVRRQLAIYRQVRFVSAGAMLATTSIIGRGALVERGEVAA